MVYFNWIFWSKTANYTIILSVVSVFPVTVSNGSWLNPLRRLNKINALDIQYVHLPRIVLFLISPSTLCEFHNLRPQLRYRVIYMWTKSIIKLEICINAWIKHRCKDVAWENWITKERNVIIPFKITDDKS